jgi:hypothetical protein
MEDNGFKIYGIIFDCGNKTLIKELEIESGGKYFFPNPCDPTRNVYFFPGTFFIYFQSIYSCWATSVQRPDGPLKVTSTT